MSDTDANNFLTINDLPDDARSAIQAAMRGEPILTLPAEFDQFDPLNGAVPYELSNIARRARKLLEHVDRDRILAAVTFAELATTVALVDKKDPERQLTDAEIAAFSGELDELRPITLFRRIPLLDQMGMKPSELSWSVVFASLALAYVARSVNNDVNHGIEATDALARAEVFSAKSAAGRTKPVNDQFKLLLGEYIQENPGLKGAEYARRFIRLHSDEMRNRHGRAFSEKTVAKWANDIIRAQIPTQ